MKPSEIIREARTLLFERGWSQGHYQSQDGRLCILGALNVATTGNARSCSLPTYDAELALSDVLEDNLPRWNDDPCRTFDEVIELFDKAEKVAEAREDS